MEKLPNDLEQLDNLLFDLESGVELLEMRLDQALSDDENDV